MATKNSSSYSTTILGISTTMILILTAALILSSTTVDASSSSSSSTHHLLSWSTAFQRTCEGSIGECSDEEEEFGMDSEINRRILATTQYISYEALKRNTVPCSRRGASYYNCKPGAAANPYTRGCSAITRCRS